MLLEEHDQGLAAGQYGVFYRGEQCVASGKILEEPLVLPPRGETAGGALAAGAEAGAEAGAAAGAAAARKGGKGGGAAGLAKARRVAATTNES